ncbi:MAG: hypothetical protein ABSE82_16010, partial [Nitrososphaerales archaeon]
QIIGEMITGIPSGKLGTRGELCLKCLGFIMFDAADESERSLDLRRLPPDQRKILARLNR